jgi:5'-3' exonuclease
VYPIILDINKDKSVLMISSDMDWMRLLTLDNRKIHCLSHGKLIRYPDFYEKYGFDPTIRNVVLFKTFSGDESDNIPIPVPGLPHVIIKEIMEDIYEDIYDFYNNLDLIKYIPNEWKEALWEKETRVKLNYQLVSFMDVTKEDLRDFIQDCKYRPRELRILYNSCKVNFKSVDERLYRDLENDKIEERNKKELSEDSFFQYPKV